MDVGEAQQFVPEIGVQRRFLVALHPAAGLPALGPALFQSVDHILGVRPEIHDAGLLQNGEGLNHGSQLHAVVGGIGFAAGEFPLVGTVHEDGAPTARTGIAAAGSVGINRYCFHINSSWGALPTSPCGFLLLLLLPLVRHSRPSLRGKHASGMFTFRCDPIRPDRDCRCRLRRYKWSQFSSQFSFFRTGFPRYVSMASATPSWSQSATTTSAMALMGSMALPMATPRPAARIIS